MTHRYAVLASILVLASTVSVGAAPPAQPKPDEKAAKRAALFDESMRRLFQAQPGGTAFIFADSHLSISVGPEPAFQQKDWRIEAGDALFLRGTIAAKNVTIRYGSRLERDADVIVIGKLVEETTRKDGAETAKTASRPVKQGRPGPPVVLFAMPSGALTFSEGPVKAIFAPNGALTVTDEKGNKKQFDSAEAAQRQVPALVRLIGRHWLRTGLDKRHLAALSYVAYLRETNTTAFTKAFSRMERQWTIEAVEKRIADAGLEAAYKEHAGRFRTDDDRAKATAAANLARREADASEKLKKRLGEEAGFSVEGAPLMIWAAFMEHFAHVEIEITDEAKETAADAVVGEAESDAPLRDYLSAVLAAADLDWRAAGDKVLVVMKEGK